MMNIVQTSISTDKISLCSVDANKENPSQMKVCIDSETQSLVTFTSKIWSGTWGWTATNVVIHGNKEATYYALSFA